LRGVWRIHPDHSPASFDVYQRYEFVAEKRGVIEAWGFG
jgi:hypothetical protein